MRCSIARLATWLVILPSLVLGEGFAITAAQIEKIAPSTASCDNSGTGAECATAAQAVPAINGMLKQWKLSTAGEKAALISLMLFESGNFRYNRNHFPAPGRPGQGTRNMQMAKFNALYADYQVTVGSLKKEEVDAAKSKNDEGKAVLDLLLPVGRNDMDFSSAGWFLKTQCNPAIAQGLQDGSEQGWEAYITQCVQTTVTDDRKDVWKKALQVFAGDGSSKETGSNPSSLVNDPPISSTAPAATTMITQIIPSAPTAASAPASSAPQAPQEPQVPQAPQAPQAPAASNDGSTGSSSVCSGGKRVACSSDGLQFGLCQDGAVKAWQRVAGGTKCVNEEITYA